MKRLFIGVLLLCSVTASAQNFFWVDWETNNLINLRHDENKKEQAEKARKLGYFVFYPNKSVEVVKDTTYRQYDFLREKTIKFSYKGYNLLISYQNEPIRDDVASLFPKNCLTILYVKGGIRRKFCDYYLNGVVDEYHNDLYTAQREYEKILEIALSYFKE